MVLKNNNSKTDNRIGQIFTPSYIAEFMVNNLMNFIDISGKIPQTLRVLEPSVGEGIFLQFLLKFNFSNITAYEMDYNLKEYLVNSYPNVEFKFENFLGSDPSEKFDLIIGNPPYLGQNYNAPVFQDYIKKFPFCEKYFVGNMDLFYFFIHLGIEKLRPGGILTFITTNYWITKSKKTGIKLLKPHLLEECFLLQYIDLAHLHIFKGAKGQHNCIFVLQKKTKQEKIQKVNKYIEIIQIFGIKPCKNSNKSINERIFRKLTYKEDSSYVRRFISSLTNNNLKKDESWNLIYPKDLKILVNKIENYCKINGKISFLKDYFFVRNGLILIKDSIFILKEGKNLKIENNDFFILVNGKFLKLNKIEISRLKKIYKSKSIKPYGYDKDGYIGYIIYFNKNEFNSKTTRERNRLLERKYPILSKYLNQFETQLIDILINAKENPEDMYFPRRGSFIRRFDEKKKEKLLDLEQLYDSYDKIFFKFISNKNIFGYSNEEYYATSDTYFLWPKSKEINIDYLFMLAYLNSKIVHFLYKSKNILIKRSKTKLEHSLPIPQLENFTTPDNIEIINLIKILTSLLINNNIKKNNWIDNLSNSGCYSVENYKEFKMKIINAVKSKNYKFIEESLDTLFFKLFDINQIELNYLLNKYYFF
ncbi:MAG: N-6 DNA methylase [Promethearchaeota archaeon]|nr:MAG: N-6 DNA methylase [Candidatus Lokiarchaeota archaeon]